VIRLTGALESTAAIPLNVTDVAAVLSSNTENDDACFSDSVMAAPAACVADSCFTAAAITVSVRSTTTCLADRILLIFCPPTFCNQFRLSIRPPVSLSVRHRYCVQTAKQLALSSTLVHSQIATSFISFSVSTRYTIASYRIVWLGYSG